MPCNYTKNYLLPDKNLNAQKPTWRIIIHSANGLSLYRFRRPLIDLLRQRGHRVLAVGRKDASFALLQQAGIDVADTGSREDSAAPFALLNFLRLFWSIMRRERPHIVHHFSLRAIILGAPLSWLFGAIGYATVTGFGRTGSLKWYHPFRLISTILLAAAGRCCRRVLFQNPDDRDWCVRHRIIPALRSGLVVSSGVDCRSFRRHHPQPTEPVVFTFMARMLISKGIAIFLQAAAIIAAEVAATTAWPRAHFLVIGGTSDSSAFINRDYLAQLCRPLAHRVEITGHLDDPRPYLERSSVFVLPSFYREGVPRSILEAMAYELAIITCDMPGCRETVVSGENGFLVAPHSVTALVGRMRYFLTNPQAIAVMGQASRRRVERHFDAQSIAQRTAAIYAL